MAWGQTISRKTVTFKRQNYSSMIVINSKYSHDHGT